MILGSKSDLPIADKCRGILEKFEVSFEIRVASAHRAPKYLEGIVDNAESEGCKVFIGMAGVAAALPRLKVKVNTGNFTEGRITVYGITNTGNV